MGAEVDDHIHDLQQDDDARREKKCCPSQLWHDLLTVPQGEYEMTLTPNLLYLATNIKHNTLFYSCKKELYREKAASYSYRN